jgi:hypothetical protein
VVSPLSGDLTREPDRGKVRTEALRGRGRDRSPHTTCAGGAAAARLHILVDIVSGVMRFVLCPLILALALAGCGTDDSSATFTLANGSVYSVTDCPSAGNLLIGGYGAADALPAKGQTDRARVEAEFEAVRDQFVGSNDVVEVNVIPRNGEVWYPLADGGHAVELVEDFQYEVILGPDGVCPSAPYSVSGVPVLYNRVDG